MKGEIQKGLLRGSGISSSLRETFFQRKVKEGAIVRKGKKSNGFV